MSSDIFISHSSKDQKVARTICTALENRGLTCWIYSRNIQPGQNFQEQIVRAIRAAKIMVLVFTANANSSSEIKKELAIASQNNLVVIPVRIEDVIPNEAFAYEFSTRQWIDLFENWESSIARLVELIANTNADKQLSAHTKMDDRNGETSSPSEIATKLAVLPKRSGLSVVPLAISAIAIAAVGIAALFYITGSHNALPGQAPSIQATQIPTTARGEQTSSPDTVTPVVLVPEDVPFIRDSERATLRRDYLSAPDHKALALSFTHAGFASNKPDEKTAIAAAMESCRIASDAVGKGYTCQLYAVGNAVVYKAGLPPMPPEPWFQDDPVVSRPFAAKSAPMASNNSGSWLDTYATSPTAKALAVNSGGGFSWRMGNQTQDEAVRRTLEICGAISGFACMIVAVDNNFVVQAPMTMRAIGFFRAASESLIAPEMRQEVARRLGNATKGWSAVATGSGGRPGIAVKAATEQAAADGALGDCQAIDRDCRVIAIGPFRVVPRTQAQIPSQPSGK